jgi:hypothetical protein
MSRRHVGRQCARSIGEVAVPKDENEYHYHYPLPTQNDCTEDHENVNCVDKFFHFGVCLKNENE